MIFRQKLVLIIYLVLFVQFIFSNLLFALGPHYIFSSGIQCTPTALITSCVTSLPYYSAPPDFIQSKGFPFATNEYQPYLSNFGDNSYPINDSNAVKLNFIYIVSVTVVAGLGFLLLKKPKSKSV